MTDPNIENELQLKRIKPEAFIAQFEKFFDNVATTYHVTSRERRQQRSNAKAHFKPYDDLIKIMDIGDIAGKAAAYAEAVAKAASKHEPAPSGPDFKAVEADLKERTRFINDFDTKPKEFKKIMDEYQINQLRDQLTGRALNGILASNFLGAITKVLLLIVAILISLFVEEPMTKLLVDLGEQRAVILTTVVVYFTLDIVVDWLKDQLLWRRVRTCYHRYIKVREIIGH